MCAECVREEEELTPRLEQELHELAAALLKFYQLIDGAAHAIADADVQVAVKMLEFEKFYEAERAVKEASLDVTNTRDTLENVQERKEPGCV